MKKEKNIRALIEANFSEDGARAIFKMYSDLYGDYSSVLTDYENNYLSFNEARNGRIVLWLLTESINRAIYVDDLSPLDGYEIAQQLL